MKRKSIEKHKINYVELEIGDIVLYKGNGFFSKLVRFFTKSEYSHVSMMLSDKLSIEANWYKKSNVVPIKYDKDTMEFYRVKGGLTDKQKLVLLQHSYNFLNKVYDYPQIFGYVIRFFDKSKINLFNSTKRLICSELIDRAYLKLGIDLSSENYIGDVTPKDIANSDKLTRIL